jgi:hypothetical protein
MPFVLIHFGMIAIKNNAKSALRRRARIDSPFSQGDEATPRLEESNAPELHAAIRFAAIIP